MVFFLPVDCMILYGMLVVMFLAGVAGLLYLVWVLRSPTVKRSHVYRIGRSHAVLEKLNEIGADNPARIIGYLRTVDAFLFEEVLLTALEKRGFTIGRNHRYTGDAGLDGRFWDRYGHEYIIQAKRYKGFISRQHVASFAALIGSSPDVIGGLFIHTWRTPSELIRTMRSSGVTIISGEKLIELLLRDSEVLVYPLSDRIS